MKKSVLIAIILFAGLFMPTLSPVEASHITPVYFPLSISEVAEHMIFANGNIWVSVRPSFISSDPNYCLTASRCFLSKFDINTGTWTNCRDGEAPFEMAYQPNTGRLWWGGFRNDFIASIDTFDCKRNSHLYTSTETFCASVDPCIRGISVYDPVASTGSDDQIYFTGRDSGLLLELCPECPLPADTFRSHDPGGATDGASMSKDPTNPDNLYILFQFPSGARVARWSFSNRQFNLFCSMPAGVSTTVGQDLEVDGSGNVWVTTFSNVYKMTPADCSVNTISVPSSNVNLHGLVVSQANDVWFFNQGSPGQIGVIRSGTTTAAIAVDNVQTGGVPTGPTFGTVDSSGRIYAIMIDANAIVRITDSSQLSSSISLSVSPATITIGSSTTLSGSITPAGNVPDGTGVLLEYDRGSGWNTIGTTSTQGGAYSYFWTPQFTGTASVRASWSGNVHLASASSIADMEVVPLFDASFTYSRANNNIMTQVSFTASASGGRSPYRYSWDFGDGTVNAGNPINHRFKKAGNLTVTLTVDDSSGQQAFFSQEILVTMTLHDEFSLDWADHNNDGRVTIVDVSANSFYFDKTCSTLAEPDRARCDYWDFDRNGVVSLVDLSIVAYYFDTFIDTGIGAVPYTMSPMWQGRCGELPAGDQPYCMSRGF